MERPLRGHSQQLLSSPPSTQGRQFSYFDSHNRGSFDDDDEDREQQDDKNKKWFCLWRKWRGERCRTANGKRFVPNYTPLWMLALIVVVCLILFLDAVSEDGWDISIPYCIYIGISIAIFVWWLFLRYVWWCCVNRSARESQFTNALATIIDPQLSYLAATVTLCLFWAYLPATGVEGRLLKNVLGLHVIKPDAMRTLLKTNLFLVTWAVRGIVLRLLVFKFLTGLLMTLNRNLVKYLTHYRLVRKMNASWLRLRPLAMHTSPTRTSSAAATSDADALRRKTVRYSINEFRKSRHYGRLTPWKRDRTIEALKDLAEPEDPSAELRGLPRILSRANIRRTEMCGMTNLLTLEYCRQYPATLFVEDTEYQLVHKRVAKEVGGLLFDQIVAFRDSFCHPSMSEAERNHVARQAILTTRQSLRDLQPQQQQQQQLKLPRLRFSRRRQTVASSPSSSAHYPSQEKKEGVSFYPKIFQSDEKQRSSFQGNSSVCSVDLNAFLDVPWNDSQTPHAVPRPDDSDNDTTDVEAPVDKERLSPYPVIHWRDAYSHQSLKGVQVDLQLQLAEAAALPPNHLTREFLSLFLEGDTDQFMELADAGGRGIVTKENFVALVLATYHCRKQLVHAMASQEALKNIVTRTLSASLAFLLLLVFLLLMGVAADTIIVSGAAAVSSCTVILSNVVYGNIKHDVPSGFIYTGFIQAVIFVCFLNPYNVGDRVVLDSRVRTVKKIHTYYTEFYSMLGQVESLNHATLFSMTIRNDTRCQHAGLELPFLIEYSTPQSKYEALDYLVEQYVQHHQELVSDSFFCILNEFVIDHYIKFTYWITVVASWGQWKSVYQTKAMIVEFITRQCEALDIRYQLAIQPVEIYQCDNAVSHQTEPFDKL